MSERTNRTKNQFGKRYIRLHKFRGYAVDLNLAAQEQSKQFFEYLEREGLLTPIARVRLPGEIARRFESDHNRKTKIPSPIEGDTPRLNSAAELWSDVAFGRWSYPNVQGKREHYLDANLPEHSDFVQKDFDPSCFIPWQELRTLIYREKGQDIYDGGQYAPTFYHYWQIFALAAILRSGVRILYPLEDEEIGRAMLKFDVSGPNIRERINVEINLEARRELLEINQHKSHFEAVAYFQAYSNNTLQTFRDQIDKRTGLMTTSASKEFLRLEREIAERSLSKFSMSAADIFEFIKQQTDWWDTARRVGPGAVADEYKRNISTTIDLYCHITGENSESISDRIGQRGGWRKPILEVIFPSWLDEQRDLTIRSLRNWAAAHFAGLPAPFDISESDIELFCDWLEASGLYQYYWHFMRFLELDRRHDDIHAAAAAAETVAFANLVEIIANTAFEERYGTARGHTLAFKLRSLFGPSGPVDLDHLLREFKGLTRTNNSTLRIRLAQINRIRQGGHHSPILRVLLKLTVIRNEGSHIGLKGYDRVAILNMLETMAIASLLIWKTR